MVTVVDLAGEEWEDDPQEGVGLNARVAHGIEETARHAPAADVVIQHSHLHAGPGALDEHLAHAAPNLVVGYDIVLQMDVVARAAECLEEGGEFFLAGGVYVDVAAVEERRATVSIEHAHQRTISGRYVYLILTRSAGAQGAHNAAIGASGDDSTTAIVLPEEKIEDETNARQGEEDNDPRNGLQRVAILQQDYEGETQHGEEVQAEEGDTKGRMYGEVNHELRVVLVPSVKVRRKP